MACHLSSLVTFGLAFLMFGFALPLAIWLYKRETDPFVDHHGKESLNFELNVLFWYLISIPLSFCLIGIPMLLAIFPFRGQLYEPAGSSPLTTTRVLIEFARSNDVQVVDLQKAMLEGAIREGVEPAAYMLDESHPSQRGHALVARALALYIAQEGILSRAGDRSRESAR